MRTQVIYDTAVAEVFETLDWLEERFTARRLLAGDGPTAPVIASWMIGLDGVRRSIE